MTRDDEGVALVAADPGWAERYRSAAAALLAVLPGRSHPATEHIGSTSVPGLSSKDTVDIAVVVDDVAATLDDRTLDALAAIGFQLARDSFADDPDHAFLARKDRSGHRTEHVHVLRRGSATLASRLLFRDHLRAHPEVAAAYDAAKRELAGRHPGDRDGYVTEKTAIVEEILRTVRRP